MNFFVNINITVQGSQVIGGVAPAHLGAHPGGCNQHISTQPSRSVGTIALGNGCNAELIVDGPMAREGIFLSSPQPNGVTAAPQAPPGPLHQINISISV